MKLQMLKPRIQMAQQRIKTIQQTRNPEAEKRSKGKAARRQACELE